MKKLIAAVLAVLCLAGCSAKEEKAEMIGVTVVTKSENPVVETEKAPSVQEFEIEVETENPQEALPEDLEPGEGGSVAVPVEDVEGLVGDTVGYSFQKTAFTEFAASETMNDFYTELVNGLVEYANGAVNETCLKENCIASVYGKVLRATLTGDTLDVQYECRVEYSSREDAVVNVRTDSFNVQTGEVTSNVK